eukprot:gene853-1660_t
MIRGFSFEDDPFFSSFGGRGRRQQSLFNTMDNFFNDFNSGQMVEPSHGIHSPGQTYSSSSMSFSSYSSSNGGDGQPVVVTKSMKEIHRPGGVVERTQQFHDSRQGVEGVSVSRLIGDRGRIVSKLRERDGTEKTIDTLHNLDEESMDSFDGQWDRLTNHRPQIGDGVHHSYPNSRVELLEEDTSNTDLRRRSQPQRRTTSSIHHNGREA